MTPLQFGGRENTIFVSEFWVGIHPPTNSHTLSDGLDSAENVPLPATAKKKREMTRCFIRYQTNQAPLTRLSLISRPKPTAPTKLSAKDKRSASARKPKQMYARRVVLWRALLTIFRSSEEDTKSTRAPMLWVLQQHLDDMMIKAR